MNPKTHCDIKTMEEYNKIIDAYYQRTGDFLSALDKMRENYGGEHGKMSEQIKG